MTQSKRTIPPVASFNYFRIQLASYAKLWAKVKSSTGVANKLRAIFYGPGWFENHKPELRLGDPSCLPPIKPVDLKTYYDPRMTPAMQIYTFVQFITGLIIFDHFLQIQAEPFFEEKDTYSWTCGLVALVWIFWTYWSIGELCSCRVHSSELLRVCLTGLFLLKPSAFLDDVKLPQLLALPFFLSAFGYTRIHTAKSTNK